MSGATDHKLPFGEDASGRLVGVDAVVRGAACGLVCPQCRAPLTAKKGQINRHHFAHESDRACHGAGETMLHKLAKQIIADAKGIWLPELWAVAGIQTSRVVARRWFELDSIALEVWKEGIRPDLIGRKGEREIAIEVLVSHRCGEDKIAAIQTRALACIEIDLSGARGLADEFRIKEAVLSSAPRSWLFNAKLAPAVAALRAIEDERLARIARDLEVRRRAAETARAAEQKREAERYAAEAAASRIRLAKLSADAEERGREAILRAARKAEGEAWALQYRHDTQLVHLEAFKADFFRTAADLLGEAYASATGIVRTVQAITIGEWVACDGMVGPLWAELRAEVRRRDDEAELTVLDCAFAGGVFA